jgi:hypothetical protein
VISKIVRSTVEGGNERLQKVDVPIDPDNLVALAGQIGGTSASPDIRGMRETSGPTLLTYGAVSDGQFLRRSGSTVIGDTPGVVAHNLGGAQHNADTLANLNTKVSDADLVALAGQIGGTSASPDIRGMRETSGPTLLTYGAVSDNNFLMRSGTGVVGAAEANYALLAGRSGGQILHGGTAASNALTLRSTAHATKGEVQVEDMFRLASIQTINHSSGDIHNLTINPVSIVRINNTSAGADLTGIVATGSSDGRVFILQNVGTQTLFIINGGTSSTAANRFAMNNHVDLFAGMGVVVWRDATANRWRVCAVGG